MCQKKYRNKIKKHYKCKGDIGMTCKKEWKQGRDRTTIYVVIESCAKVYPYISVWDMNAQTGRCRDVLCTIQLPRIL